MWVIVNVDVELLIMSALLNVLNVRWCPLLYNAIQLPVRNLGVLLVLAQSILEPQADISSRLQRSGKILSLSDLLYHLRTFIRLHTAPSGVFTTSHKPFLQKSKKNILTIKHLKLPWDVQSPGLEIIAVGDKNYQGHHLTISVRCLHSSQRILNDSTHPSYRLFTLLTSYKQYRIRCLYLLLI